MYICYCKLQWNKNNEKYWAHVILSFSITLPLKNYFWHFSFFFTVCSFWLVTTQDCEILRAVFYICTNLGSICEEFVWLGQSLVACQFYSLGFHLDVGMLYIPKFLLIAIHLHVNYSYLILVKACLWVWRKVVQLWHMSYSFCWYICY